MIGIKIESLEVEAALDENKGIWICEDKIIENVLNQSCSFSVVEDNPSLGDLAFRVISKAAKLTGGEPMYPKQQKSDKQIVY